MPAVPEFLYWPRLHELAGPIYLLVLAVEYVLVTRWAARGTFTGSDTRTSIVMGAGSAAIAAVFLNFLGGMLGVGALVYAYDHRIMTVGFEWWAFVLCFIIDDLRFYWAHRIEHRVRWFWAEHVVHHSSTHFNFSTALRQSWTTQIAGLVLTTVPLGFLGFHPLMLAFTFSLNLFYQFFIHTQMIGRMPGWFEAVFNTPSHHRVHHARNPRYLDANYAGVLIVWDKLFGTFVPELERDPPEFGLVKNIETYNPLRVAGGEYVALARDVGQRGAGVLDRVRYVFAPPGWSHDGSRLDSHAIKAAYLRENPGEAGSPGL